MAKDTRVYTSLHRRRNLLRIPILEVYGLTENWDDEQLRKSITTILDTTRSADGFTEVEKGTERRTSVAVLSAIHLRWCNIPPICPRVNR